jgi:Bacterial Ig domain
MKLLKLTRHMIAMMFLIAALLGPLVGTVAAADKATPVAGELAPTDEPAPVEKSATAPPEEVTPASKPAAPDGSQPQSLDAGTNEAPVANDDSFTVAKETILTVNAPGLLANDTDPNNDSLVVTGVTAKPANGTIEANTLNADGSFRYLARLGFVGTDTFSYTVSDGFLTDVGTVTITVTDPTVNTPPSTTNDSYSTPQDTVLTVDAPGVLANDTDPDGDQIFALLILDKGPSHGQVDLFAEDGSFTYTPNRFFAGTDSFAYFAFDSRGEVSEVTTVTITVIPNSAPVAVDDSFTTLRDTTLTVDAPGVLANDSDPERDAFFALLILDQGPLRGKVDLFKDNGSFTYIPDPGFVGTDSFAYFAFDSFGGVSEPTTVTITVTEANQPPTGQADQYKAVQNKPLTVSAAKGLLANDSDPEGDKLTAKVETPPSQGTMTLNPDGSFTYTPKKGFKGKDQFSYRPFDGTASGNVVTVQITVGKAASQ